MKKINESFICLNCKKKIWPASRTCRNHCPHCFASTHIDDKIPWDRKANCNWNMFPINFEYKTNWTKILFKCIKCEKEHRNKQTDDDNIWDLIDLIEKYKIMFI